MVEQVSAGSPSRVQETAELVRRLCTAMVTVEMFPPDHPQARDSVTHAYKCLTGILSRQPQPVVISASGRQIILDGLPLEDKNPLVSKLAAKLGDIHIQNLFFDPGVSADEFQDFFRLLGRGSRHINEQGGIRKLMAETPIRHVSVRDVSYVMVAEDQKVVSRDAKVVDAEMLTRLESDAELAQHIAGAVLKRAGEQKWLLTEMKNNPGRMAQLIAEGINSAASRTDGDADPEAAIGTLLDNIKLVGRSLIDEQTGAVNEGQDDLEHAVLQLEQEVRLRSKQFTSSRVAAGFINEVLALVTSYSDRVRAKHICNQFLRDEKSLKQTEKLLRQMAPGEPPEECLKRLRALLLGGGVTEHVVNDWVSGLEQKKAAPKAAKPRRRAPAAVADGLARRLAGLKLQPTELQEVVENLGAFVEQRAREKAAATDARAAELRLAIEHREEALNNVPVGVILWDLAGKIEYANAAARELLKSDRPGDLRPAVRDLLRKWTFPLSNLDILASAPDLSETEIRFLFCIAKVFPLAQQDVFGAVLVSENGKPPT